MSEERTSAVPMGLLVEAARDPAASLESRHAAFTRLVEQSQHLVLGYALAYLRDLEDARDVAQEAFTTAWRRLSQLRDAHAFPAWLNAIVSRECAKRRRRRAPEPGGEPRSEPSVIDTGRLDYASLIASAIDSLPEGERLVTILFYFLDYTLPEIARLLRIKPGTAGKRLHSARLRLRRVLPRSVRGDFMRLTPSGDFVERVRRGLLDEYVGEYRFEQRPDLVVRIAREGDSLVSDAADQRHVLISGREHSLITRHYDGEGRFRRNRRGEVTHFVYYEFGKRLGVARKMKVLS